jgi:thiol-disulfide isomerase/thioredoxin
MIETVDRKGWKGAAVIGLLALLAAGCGQRAETPDAPSPAAGANTASGLLAAGDLVPEYRTVTPHGDTLQLGPQQPVTLLNLWATWCGPCIEEFPDLERLHRQLEPAGLRIIAVDVDPDAPETVLSFAADLGVTFTVATDPEGRIEERFQSMALPSSYLIDGEGRLVARWTGALKPAALETIEAYFTER